MKVNYNKRDKCFYTKYQDGKGVWKAKNVPVNIQDENEAKSYLAHWFNQLSITKVEPLPCELPKVHTIASVFPLIEKYWEQDKTAKSGDKIDPKTAKDWISRTKNHILTHSIASVPLTVEAFTPVKLVAWIEGLKKNLAKYTVKDCVFILRTLIGDGRKKGWITLPFNPVADEIVASEVPTGQPRTGKDNPIHLTRHQLFRLLACESKSIPLDRKVKNLVASLTGARDGELQGLAWKHIDLKQRTMVIERQLPTGSNASSNPDFKPPKKGSIRTVPLHSLAVRALQMWKRHMRGEANDPVFPNEGGQYWRPRSALFFKHDLLAAGLSDKFQDEFSFDFHATRRTFLTMLSDAGVSPEDQGIMAGHAKKGVRKHYVASTPETLARFLREIDRLPLPEGELSWLQSAGAKQSNQAAE